MAIWKLKVIHEFGSTGAISVALRTREAAPVDLSVFKACGWWLVPSDVDVLSTCLALLHSAAEDLVAPLARFCTRFSPTGVTWNSHVFSFPFFLVFYLSLSLRVRSPTCTTERHKTDLHCEMYCDEGLARLIWNGPFATLSKQNHKYIKDGVSSLALSCIGLSNLHAITLINYFSLLIPVCLHEADNKIWAEGAATRDKIEAWTFFRLTQLLYVIWGDNRLFSLVASKTKAAEISKMGGVVSPTPTPFAADWDEQNTPNGATYTHWWEARANIPTGTYTCFHAQSQHNILSTASWEVRFPCTKASTPSSQGSPTNTLTPNRVISHLWFQKVWSYNSFKHQCFFPYYYFPYYFHIIIFHNMLH